MWLVHVGGITCSLLSAVAPSRVKPPPVCQVVDGNIADNKVMPEFKSPPEMEGVFCFAWILVFCIMDIVG